MNMDSYNYYVHFGWNTDYNNSYVADSAMTKGAAVYY